jgi:hypothetical protein
MATTRSKIITLLNEYCSFLEEGDYSEAKLSTLKGFWAVNWVMGVAFLHEGALKKAFAHVWS